MSDKVLIITTVSPDGVEVVLDAIAAAGGGIVGDYSHCAFTSAGHGHFKPNERAQPHVGERGQVNQEAEIRIETFCPRERAKSVVDALRAAHPYEEPVIYIVPLLNEADL